MTAARGTRPPHEIRQVIVVVASIATATIAASCGGDQPRKSEPSASAVLRVGIGPVSAANPLSGMRQLMQLQTLESLFRVGEDGRIQPWIAESWTVSQDSRSVTVNLRPSVKFHDGTPLSADVVATTMTAGLPESLGPMYDDIDHVRVAGPHSLEIGFRHPSPLVMEGLEAQIRHPRQPTVGTGPYRLVPNSTDMEANADYYLGRPEIPRVHVETHPTVRAAWAELLRDRLDMLYDVGLDALDSLEASTRVTMFTYTRHYQYVVVLNARAPALRARQVRQALNAAIDRETLIKDAMAGHGVSSSSPIWPQHWAVRGEPPARGYSAATAASLAGRRVRFSCLVAPDSINERIALTLKRQLAAVGVEMDVEEAAQDEILNRLKDGRYDAALTELISGPTIVRPYLVWHTKSPLNFGSVGNATVDAALERVRQAPSEDAYRTAVAGLQQAFADDPPAIFLAWSVRARAVSRRFDVVTEEGRDILATLRLWKPTLDPKAQASRN